MPAIGSYEIVGEKAPGLQQARTPDGQGKVLVRVAGSGALGGLSSSVLVDRAETQSKLGQSEFWVPILELSHAPGNAYAVLPEYPDSITRYLGFTSISEGAVWTVMNRLVSGLNDYREATGRPHGNIKPANVLLESTRGSWWRTVRLTDPLGPAELGDPLPWREDLRAVGELMCRLVLQRPLEPIDVPSLDEPWTRALGPRGRDWRELCADLLDPVHSINLDTVRERVAGLQPKQSASRRIVRLAAILIPVVFIPLGALQWPADPTDIPTPLRSQVIRMRCTIGIRSYDPGAWERLCDEYDTWLGTFAEAAMDQERDERWREHPYLDTLISLLQEAKSNTIDPRAIGGEARAYADLKENHPDEARTCTGYELTFAALDHVESIKHMIKQASRDQGGWPALRYLADSVAERCDEAGWDQTAGLLKAFPGDLQPRHDGAEYIDHILEWWDGVGEPMAKLNSRLAELSTVGSPGLARLSGAVTAEIHKGSERSRGDQEDIDQLRGYVMEADKVAREIEEFTLGTWSQWGENEKRDWHREEEALFSSASATPDLDVFRRWIREARQFTSDDSASWLGTVEVARDDLTTSQALNETWRRRTTALVGDVTRGDLRSDPARNASLRKEVEGLRYFLTALDDQSILPFTPLPGIGDAIQAKREETLQQILALYKGEEPETLKQSAPVQQLCADYRRWRRELPLLATALARTRELVTGLYAFEDVATEDSASISSVLETWSATDIGDAGKLPADLAEAQPWANALATVQNETSQEELTRIGMEPTASLPVSLAAWRRLGTRAGWPTGIAQRQDEMRLRNRLENGLPTWDAGKPERTLAVMWELRTEGCRRDALELLTAIGKGDALVLEPFTGLYTALFERARSTPGDDAALAQLKEANEVAMALATVVVAPEWPGGYDQELLRRELVPPTPPVMAFFRSWPEQAQGLRLITPDPRGNLEEWDLQFKQLSAERDALAAFAVEHEQSTQALTAITDDFKALEALPPVQRHAEQIRTRHEALTAAVKTYRETYALLDPNPVRPASYWEEVLRLLSKDITELAADRAELRQGHNELTQKVDTLLATAPIRSHEESIIQQLRIINDAVTLLGDEVDPGVWLDRELAHNKVSEEALPNDIWLRLRDGQLQGLTGESLKADRGNYRVLRDRLSSLAAFLGGRDWSAALPAALPPPTPGLPERDWHGALQTRLTYLRQNSLEGVARLHPRTDAEVQGAEEAYRQSRAMLAKARDELTMADSRLAAWALPREPLNAIGTIRIGECLKGWQDQPDLVGALSTAPELREFCEGLFSINDRLVAVANQPQRDAVRHQAEALVQTIGGPPFQPRETSALPASSSADLLLLHATYSRLGETGWPLTLDQMHADYSIMEALLGVIPASRKDSLGQTISAEGGRRWARGFEALSECKDIFGGGLDMLHSQYGLTAAQAQAAFTDLALHARVNLTIAVLLEALSKDTGTEAALQARDRTALELIELSRQVKYPDPRFVDIQKRITLLRDLEGEGGAGAIRGLAQSGPGRQGWQATIEPGRERVSFSTVLGGTPYTLTFLRIDQETDGAPDPVFVCTTEVPVGMFIDVCANTRDGDQETLWPNLLSFYAEALRTTAQDPRMGPRTWRPEQTGEVTSFYSPPPRWLAETEDFAVADHYPRGMDPGSPNRSHPAQYIPPRAAAYFALKLGCRLPTPTDWQHALDQRGTDPRPPNLRDELCYQQYQHILLLRPQKRGLARLGRGPEKHWPTADAFPFDSRVPAEDTAFNRGGDGFLWFREVPGGGHEDIREFTDMAGNVGEFTYSDRAELDRLLDLDSLTVESIRDELAEPYKFGVIGDTALSTPARSERRHEAVRIPSGTEGWITGFSDVGIRLAFTAPDENLPDKLRELAESLCMGPDQR